MKKCEIVASCLVLLLVAACGRETPPVETDAAVDAGKTLDVGALDADIGVVDSGRADATYELLKSQPATSRHGQRRGRAVVRGLIHAHSLYSHDACDSKPQLDDGSPNEPCLSDFRNAICETRQDFVFLTEHEELAALTDYEDLLLLRGEDERVLDETGRAVANRMHCENGHEALLLPGGEFGVMPVGMPAHLPGTPQERDIAYNEVTPARVQSLKDLGAVVLRAHTESKDRDELRSLNLDGFEVYQLHANLAPDIREEWLGLSSAGYFDAIIPFVQGKGGNPDLMFLAFAAPNRPSLAHFDALVSEGQHLTGTGGTDCHQNSLPMKMTDNERVDSYRRMMRWFSNHLFVDDLSPQALRDSLLDGRLAIVFEVLGTPADFDFVATAGGSSYEMGEAAPLGDTPVLRLQRPSVLDWGSVPVRLEILKIEADGAVVVAEGTDTLEYEVTEAGAYRAIVYITPEHLAPHLDEERAPLAAQEHQWIWFNPIYVE